MRFCCPLLVSALGLHCRLTDASRGCWLLSPTPPVFDRTSKCPFLSPQEALRRIISTLSNKNEELEHFLESVDHTLTGLQVRSEGAGPENLIREELTYFRGIRTSHVRWRPIWRRSLSC